MFIGSRIINQNQIPRPYELNNPPPVSNNLHAPGLNYYNPFANQSNSNQSNDSLPSANEL